MRAREGKRRCEARDRSAAVSGRTSVSVCSVALTASSFFQTLKGDVTTIAIAIAIELGGGVTSAPK
jgi:hypothetical protein